MKRKTKENKLKTVWKQIDDVSNAETKRRLDGAFDILFSKVKKRDWINFYG